MEAPRSFVPVEQDANAAIGPGKTDHDADLAG
jgi:hypothetical protein